MGERDALSAALAEMQTQHTTLSETVGTVVRMLLERRQGLGEELESVPGQGLG